MPPAPFQLCIRNQILEDRLVDIPEGGALVGRGERADISLEDGTISRFHARLTPAATGVLITDLDSSNGTFIDEVRVSAATLARAGSAIRFGAVRCELRGAGLVAAGTQAPQPRRWTTVAVVLALLLASAGTLHLLAPELWPEDAPGKPPDPASAVGIQPNDADAHTPSTAPPTVHEHTAEHRSEPESPTPTNAPDEGGPPGETTSNAPPSVPAQVLQLRDGTSIRGEVMPESDCETFVVHPADGGELLRLSTESVASIDGAPFSADLRAISAARASRARNPSALREHMQWCRERKLTEDERATAQRLTQLQPEADDAWRVLGTCRVLGEQRPLEEVQRMGWMDAAGLLLGPPDACREVQALHLDLLRRPALPTELDAALRGAVKDLRTALLASEEAAAVRLQALTATVITVPPDPDLIVRLAAGGVSLVEALKETARACLRAESRRDEAARSVLRIFLPEPQCLDQTLIQAATNMIAGERVALFGDRGASDDDLLAILSRQPGFYRRLVESDARLCLGTAPEVDATRKAIFRIAANIGELETLRAEWAASAQRTAGRPLDAAQSAAAAIVHGLGRAPKTGEAQHLAEHTDAAVSGDTGALIALSLPLTPPPDERGWRDLMQRCLQRDPAPAEALLFRETPAEQRGALVAALLASHEFRRSGP